MWTIHDWNIQPLFQAAPDETGSKGEDLALLICLTERRMDKWKGWWTGVPYVEFIIFFYYSWV